MYVQVEHNPGLASKAKQSEQLSRARAREKNQAPCKKKRSVKWYKTASMKRKSYTHTQTPTCTMESVAAVTGSEKSPPGGDTAPTTVTVPSLPGEPMQLARPARS